MLLLPAVWKNLVSDKISCNQYVFMIFLFIINYLEKI